jgi:hypothetical protein
METLTSAQAAGLLYAYFWLMTITSAAWMTMVMVGMGIQIELIILGTISSFKLRRSGPKVVMGLFPSASVGTSDDPEQRARLHSFGCKLLHGAGQVGLWFAAAVLLTGPTAAFDHFKAVVVGFVPSTISPWNAGPEVLRSFWTHLQSSPRDGLAMFSAASAWLNLLLSLASLANRYRGEDENGSDTVRAYVSVFIPGILSIIWLIAFVRAIYLAFAT